MTSEVKRAKRLIDRFGWNTTCYQIVNPGIDRWFSAEGDAVVGYVRRVGVRVVAGAPVVSEERLASVVEEFEGARRGGVCYFGAEGRLRARLGTCSGYSTVALGAQPVWSPQSWCERFEADRGLRAQRNRARNKGVVVREWSCEEATSHPELHRVLQEWLDTRGLPPLHFLVEPDTLGYLEGRRLFVAERAGVPVGFVTLSPVPERRGWLTEQFVRGRNAPNGTVELTLDTAIRTVAADGDRYVTMGIVPLATFGFDDSIGNPAWLRILLVWIRAHGRRFYDFDGLARFKDKFRPDHWEPIYAISKESRFSFRTLYAIAAAFTEGPPAFAVLKGLAKAVRQEWRWAVGKK